MSPPLATPLTKGIVEWTGLKINELHELLYKTYTDGINNALLTAQCQLLTLLEERP